MAEDLVKVWVPYWEGGLHTSLAVPFNGGQMTRAIYGDLLVWHMENLIKADPLAAKRLFEVMGQGAFSEVCTASPPEAWAIQVMLCDSANIVLKEIDYERGGLDNASARCRIVRGHRSALMSGRLVICRASYCSFGLPR